MAVLKVATIVVLQNSDIIRLNSILQILYIDTF